MSQKLPAGVRLKPTPVDVFRFADAATELRYRLVINYLGADPEVGEVSPPKVVRETFQKLLAVTLAINAGRPEDLKLEGHVIAGRELVDGFERKWLDPDHRLWLADRRSARQPYSELNEFDWAEIRRNGTAESDPEGLSSIDADALVRSPFNSDAWTPYEEAVAKFVDTFDVPCQTLYRLVRALAGVCYPNPETHAATLGTLSVYYDEHLIKHLRPQVNQLLAEFQSQTCFQFNFGDWFDAANPYSSFTKLYLQLERILIAWDGAVAALPELDRPRWTPAPPGSGLKGTLTFRGKTISLSSRATAISPVLEALEEVAWEQDVLLPSTSYRAVEQSLNSAMAKGMMPLTFVFEKKGNSYVCRWSETRVAGDEAVSPPGNGGDGGADHPRGT